MSAVFFLTFCSRMRAADVCKASAIPSVFLFIRLSTIAWQVGVIGLTLFVWKKMYEGRNCLIVESCLGEVPFPSGVSAVCWF